MMTMGRRKNVLLAYECFPELNFVWPNAGGGIGTVGNYGESYVQNIGGRINFLATDPPAFTSAGANYEDFYVTGKWFGGEANLPSEVLRTNYEYRFIPWVDYVPQTPGSWTTFPNNNATKYGPAWYYDESAHFAFVFEIRLKSGVSYGMPQSDDYLFSI